MWAVTGQLVFQPSPPARIDAAEGGAAGAAIVYTMREGA